MSSPDISPGSLVLHHTQGDSRLATVIGTVEDGQLQLEPFWGERFSAAPDAVELFVSVLQDRNRGYTREQLCELFFGRRAKRLQPERVEAMQHALKSAGLTFEPAHWAPGAYLRIWQDDSIVEKAGEVGEALDFLLPRWIEPQKLPPTSRDPLGFQAFAERIANELLPGLTVFTSRAGYYGLISWAIQRLNDERCPPGQTRRERFERLERAFALCEFIHHGVNDRTCSLLGQRSKSRVLGSIRGDRFRVPESILRNQSSAGAFRLYATSLVSAGFAEEAPDLGAEDKLPFVLTGAGEHLARHFERRAPEDFWSFALSDRTQERNALREWGRQLCFQNLSKAYRRTFVDSFFRGNNEHAEKRFSAALRLFEAGLLTGACEEPGTPAVQEVSSEDDVTALSELEAIPGLSNPRVLLHFYQQPPSRGIRSFQVAAVFELLSLGLSALFELAMDSLGTSGRCRPEVLVSRAAEEKGLVGVWNKPLSQAGRRAPPAHELLDRFFAEDASVERRAALGGALIARVLGEPVLAAVRLELTGNPAVELVQALPPERSLRDSYPGLLESLVVRHEQVSLNKGRQRWCYVDGPELVKDDLQQMRSGLHAMRFPQLFSLCRDLELTEKELRHGA